MMENSFKNEEGDTFKSETFLKPFPYIKFGIVSALAIFLIYQIVGGAAITLLKTSGFKSWLPWVQGFVQIVGMLLPTLWIARRTPLHFKKILRLEKLPTPRQWIFGLLGIIAIQVFTQGFVTLQDYILPEKIVEFYKNLERDFDELYRLLLGSETIWGLLRALLIGAAIPAIVEEFLFRGVMQRSLEEAMPFKKAIIVTGIIFGVIHFNLPVLIPLAIIGMYLGALAYYSESILLPVAAHFLNNALSVFSLYRESSSSVDISLLQAAGLAITGITGISLCFRQISRFEKGF
ncbi:MAG: type II CAAX endopeptidase family protein [Bacteroidota bacterium]